MSEQIPQEAQQLAKAQRERKAKAEAKADTLRVVDVGDFLAMKLPKREWLLEPWLRSKDLSMVFGKRGIGKTYFGLSLAWAVASGGTLFKAEWKAPKPRSVLLLDGEMPGVVLQERLAGIIKGDTRTESELPKADLRIIAADLQEESMPNLATTKGQQAVERHLNSVALVILDNLSTLCNFGEENRAESWVPIQEWALKLRRIGHTVVFIHHAGKGGDQRGTSKREDILDTVLALRAPSDYHAEQGARFEIHFTKSRGLLGEATSSFEAWLQANENEVMVWTTKTVEEAIFERVVDFAREGLPQVEIARELGVNRSTVCRHVKRARTEGKLA